MSNPDASTPSSQAADQMPHRTLGDGLVVGAVGLGCMSLASMYGRTDDATATAAVDRALELGVTMFDTADVYGAGHSEQVLGAAVRHRREDVVIATKFGIVANPDDYSQRAIDGSPDHVARACEDSLRRLGTDVIDLYYQHRVDLNVPVEETWGAMADLVSAGKVRHLGISEPSADSLRRAAGIHPVAAVQNEWSLWSRDVEAEILPLCRELGIGLVAYSPLGRGFLTGAISSTEDLRDGDFRLELPRFEAANLRLNRVRVAELEVIARQRDVTPAQLALAWLLNRAPDVVPIPGTSRASRVGENVAATSIRLTTDELAGIQAVFDDGVAGDRYGDMSWVSR